MKIDTEQKLMELLRYAAKKLRYLTADNLRLLAERVGNVDIPPSAYGQIMRQGAAAGIITRTDRAELSRFAGNNSVNRVLWKSNLAKIRKTRNKSNSGQTALQSAK